MVSVAVTDAELRHALAIIRSMRGEEVTAFGRARFSTGFFSRFARKRRRFENYGGELKEFDVAFLVTDDANEFGIRKRLGNALLPKKKQWDAFRNKSRTVSVAKRRKVPVPATRIIRKFKSDFDYPVYVKPALSSGSRGSRLLKNEKDADRLLPGLLEEFGNLLVQDFVNKKGTVGVEMIYDRGELKGLFQHWRVREFPLRGGPSTQRVSTFNLETLKMAKRLMKGWNGVAMVEFGLTSEGPVLFEVNPRWWGSLALAIESGVDFPKLYRDIVMGNKVEPVLKWEEGVMCKHFLFGDVRHFAARRAPVGFMKSLFEKTKYDIMSLRDPGPALARFPLAVEMVVDRKLRQRYLQT